MLEYVLTFTIPFVGGLACWLGGYSQAQRYNRRRNAATASCLGCEWSSGPLPLSEAMRAAREHTAVPHPAGFTRTMVEHAA